LTDLERVIVNSVRLSRVTKEAYLRTVKRFVAFAGPEPSNWTPKAVTSFLASLKVSPRSYAAYVAHLQYASKRFSYESGLPDFALQLEKPEYHVDKQAIRSLTVEEVEKVLNAFPTKRIIDVRNKAILGVALTSGLRRQGLTGLDLSDVDLKRRRLSVTLKGGGRFDVPLRTETLWYLKPWLALLKKERIQEGPLFRAAKTHLSEDRFAYDSYQTLCEELRTRTGIDWVHMHTFRHTFITRARELGWSTPEIAAVTGHVSDLSPDGGRSVIDTVYTDLPGLAARHPRMEEFLWEVSE
jgi:integrase